MNRDVFLSILAMDAYQRRYAPGILGVAGNQVGKAIIQNIDLPTGSEEAGFAATSYKLSEAWAGLAAGTTVVSYRGTDFDNGAEVAIRLAQCQTRYRRLGRDDDNRKTPYRVAKPPKGITHHDQFLRQGTRP